MTDGSAYAEKDLPGMLDPRRIGQLSWDERPIRPLQDQVLLRILKPAEEYLNGSPVFRELGIVIPVSSGRKAPLAIAEVLAVGPGYPIAKGKLRGRPGLMHIEPGMRVLVDGDCGWIIGPHRMVRQGAIHGEVTE